MQLKQKYSVSEVKPCADVDGYSVKGRIFNTQFDDLYKILLTHDSSAKLIKSANMVICRVEGCEFYLYEDNSFIISAISSEEAAGILIEKILDYNTILGVV